MGLGKTIQSLALIFNESRKIGHNMPSLVICPTSLTYNWLAEVNKFFTGFKAVVLEGSQQQREVIGNNLDDFDLVIINYEKVKGSLQFL